MTPGETMKRYRGARSQMDVAAAMGVHVSAVGQWERGVNTPRRDMAERLDGELGADGAVLAAFGYAAVSSPEPGMESPWLADRLDRLERALERRIDTLETQLTVAGERVVSILERLTPPSAGEQNRASQ